MFTKEEGGFGFISMFDVYQAMYAKFWWSLRIIISLWTNYMWNKYCKKQIPILVQWKGGSLVWKMMLENKDILKKKDIVGN